LSTHPVTDERIKVIKAQIKSSQYVEIENIKLKNAFHAIQERNQKK